jgi:integrase
LYASYVLMLILRLRPLTLLGLGWDDIELESGAAHISWQLQGIKGELRRQPT